MATVEIPAEQRFVLSGISWPAYVAFGDLLDERHVRLTYDRGELEFMTLSPEHERTKKLLARLLEALTEELDIDIASYGSMTCRREDLEQGLEPDACYWIANEPRVLGRTDIDFPEDPPPDLALEVEISRSALDRLGLYARLGVPEVWRWDGQTLRVCLRGPDGRYTESAHSRALPFLPMAELVRFLRAGAAMSEAKLLRTFRAWVRDQAARGWATTGEKTKGKKKRCTDESQVLSAVMTATLHASGWQAARLRQGARWADSGRLYLQRPRRMGLTGRADVIHLGTSGSALDTLGPMYVTTVPVTSRHWCQRGPQARLAWLTGCRNGFLFSVPWQMERLRQVQGGVVEGQPVQRRPQVQHVALSAAGAMETLEDLLAEVG